MQTRRSAASVALAPKRAHSLPSKPVDIPPFQALEIKREGDHVYGLWRYESLTEASILGVMHAFRTQTGAKPERLHLGDRGVASFVRTLTPRAAREFDEIYFNAPGVQVRLCPTDALPDGYATIEGVALKSRKR